MNATELKSTLTKHSAWRSGEAGGERANLGGADLSDANLSGANLSGANLSGANLSDANLSDANLSGANLSGANLSGASLSGANLSGANLSGADLSDADLSDAYLSGAYLSGANSILNLDMGDPRGYTPVAVAHSRGWNIYSGCRAFTVAEALEHWGDTYKGDREIGDRYLRAIKALPECPKVEASQPEDRVEVLKRQVKGVA